MQNSKTLARHAALVDRMSDRLGVDLEEWVLRGVVAPDVVPDLVLRCTKCPNPDACEELLNQSAQLPEAPAYCVNRDFLGGLAEQKA